MGIMTPKNTLLIFRFHILRLRTWDSHLVHLRTLSKILFLLVLLTRLPKGGFGVKAGGTIFFPFLGDGNNTGHQNFNRLAGCSSVENTNVTPKIETDNFSFRKKRACSGEVVSNFGVVEAFLFVVSFRILKGILYIAICMFKYESVKWNRCSH